MFSFLADCLFACSLPPTLFLEVLGLSKLILRVLVLGRLPVCAVFALNCFYMCWACLSLFFVSLSLADYVFVFSLPPKLFLQALGLPKLNIFVIVLGRLPIFAFSAPKIVFRGAGLAEAEYLCRRPRQTAYLRLLCPEKCV